MSDKSYNRFRRLRWLKLWHIAVVAQYIAAGVIALVPFGFDHPSWLGLDFNDFLIAMSFLACISLIAIVTAISEMSITGTLIALAIPVAAVKWWLF